MVKKVGENIWDKCDKVGYNYDKVGDIGDKVGDMCDKYGDMVKKVGCIVMLLRNLNPKKGLCNGSRLKVIALNRNSMTAEILSECNRGSIVVIPRIDLIAADSMLPFTIKRRQIPVIPAYAMTIIKAQGQTFQRVGIVLNESVFAHGQL
jgi:ATP-dependent exoDNAse (exonuclease V) alpha subunit